MELMVRMVHEQPLTIANGASLSGAFDFRLFTMGVVTMPAAWTAASIGFTVAPEESGTYVTLYDHDGTLVQISGPAVDKGYELPPELAGASWVKLFSQDGAGAAANQGAERTLGLQLKA